MTVKVSSHWASKGLEQELCVLDQAVKKYVQVWAALSALSSQAQPVLLQCPCAGPVSCLLFYASLHSGAYGSISQGCCLDKGHLFYRCPGIKDKGPKLQLELCSWIKEAGRRRFSCASSVSLPTMNSRSMEVLAKREIDRLFLCLERQWAAPWTFCLPQNVGGPFKTWIAWAGAEAMLFTNTSVWWMWWAEWATLSHPRSFTIVFH